MNDHETWVEGGVVPTLNSFDCGDTRATVLIIDGTRVNDVRVYDDEITPCLKSRMETGGNNVPFVTQETDMTDVNGSDIAATLRGFGHGWQGQHNSTNAVAQETTHNVIGTIQARSYKGPNHENARDGQLVIQGEPTMQVRRLTPIECERLMGWPDNHTLPRADGKTNSDTTRYKMCGNGVASPVAEWIGRHIMAAQSHNV